MDVQIPCPCPPKADGTARHESDKVTLRDKIDFPTAVLLQKSIQERIVLTNQKGETSISTPEVLALMSKFYVENCIETWTLVDEKGKPIQVAQAAVIERLESNLDAAMAVAEAADDLYAEVALPLVQRAFAPFQVTQSTASTSVRTSGSPKRPKPSKPSSITSIPTVVTGPISKLPDGVSKSLPSSVSAA